MEAVRAWRCLVHQHKCLIGIHNMVEKANAARLLRCFVSEWLREVLLARQEDAGLQQRMSMALLEGDWRRDVAELQERLQGEQASRGQALEDLDRFKAEAKRREGDLQTLLGNERAQHQSETAALTEQIESITEVCLLLCLGLGCGSG